MTLNHVPLSDVASLQAGIGFPLELQGKQTGPYPFAKVGDISRCGRSGNTVLSAADHYVDETDLATLRGKLVPAGSVLFAKIGEAIRQNHRVVSGCELLIDNNAMAAIPGPNTDSRFLYHFLKTVDFYHLAPATTVPAIRKSDLEKLPTPFPPLLEQRRIAAILDQADALRAKRREALAQLDNLTRSIFIEMFGDPSVNQKAWPTKRLADLVTNGDTINYGVVQPGDDVDEGVPLVRVGDLIGGRVNHHALKRITPEIESAYTRSRLHGDEILVSCVGTIGVVVLASELEKGFNIARAVARIRLSADNCREFIAAQLQTEGIQRYFTSELRTVSQPTLNIKQICETLVMQPPLEIQLDFYKRIKSVEALKVSHIDAMRKLDLLFSSLQHSAFRGEL